jgi:nuclear pore complex protein Nup62
MEIPSVLLYGLVPHRRTLIHSSTKLAALYSHITAAERQQDNIDQSLGHIEQQQKDLTATLDAYEKMSQELLGGQSGSLRTLDTGPADTERDKKYVLYLPRRYSYALYFLQ